MSLDVPLFMPYPERVSADLDGARSRNLAWMRRHGLVRGTEGVERFLRFQTAELAAYACPDASGDALDIATDLMGWFFAFDDQFDCPAEEAIERSRRALGEFQRVLDAPCDESSTDGLSLIVASFADIWHRSRAGMSPSWVARAARHWRVYFVAHVDEALGRRADTATDVDDYLDLRRITIGVIPSLDLVESMERREIPPSAYAAPGLAELRRLAAEHITCVNDLVSAEKETARGDPHNLVILLRARGRSWNEALDEVADMTDDRLRRFRSLESRLADEHGDAVRAMRHWVRGGYDWHRTSGRYQRQNVIPRGRAGYLDDLLVVP